MNLFDKLEQKCNGKGIRNLTLYIVTCYVIGYLINMTNPVILSYLNLNIHSIIHGLQLWRIVTWIIYPPSTGNFFLFAVSILFFYYPIGTALERTWGSFRYTLYIFSGIIFTVIGAFILYFICSATGSNYIIALSPYIFSTYYISLSVFLAFASMYPERQVLLWFVIPVKMKWMAIIYVAIIVYEMLQYIRSGLWFMIVPILASLLNFVIFFFGILKKNPPRRYAHRRFAREAWKGPGYASGGMKAAPSETITKHKCAVCGRTEKDDPNLEFRFCSKCNGNYEYCQDHLFTHAHIK